MGGGCFELHKNEQLPMVARGNSGDCGLWGEGGCCVRWLVQGCRRAPAEVSRSSRMCQSMTNDVDHHHRTTSPAGRRSPLNNNKTSTPHPDEAIKPSSQLDAAFLPYNITGIFNFKMKFSCIAALALVPALATAFVAPSTTSSRVLSASATAQPSWAVSTSSKYQKSSVAMNMASSLAMSSEDEEPVEEKSLGKKVFDAYVQIANVATTLFPVWTVLFTGIALKRPEAFTWFTTEYFTAALAALMLSMGITLKPADFAKVASRPNAVVMQFSLCYAMMPVLAYALGTAFGVSPALLAGMVLVGSINGGQASNLCTYIAKGNVALSVLMTTATTLGAIFMTPILCKSILGAVVPVDAAGIAMSTIQVVLAPIAIGMMTNKFFPNFVEKILPFAPVVGVVSTCLLVASAVAQVAEPIMSAGWSLQIPVLLLHLIGGLVGYALPRLTGFGEVASRTMAIETSMKSSAFGFLLAKLHFGDYAARVPSAVSVVWMALTGSILAVIWRYIPVETTGKFDRSLVEKYPPFRPKVAFGKLMKFLRLKKDDEEK